MIAAPVTFGDTHHSSCTERLKMRDSTSSTRGFSSAPWCFPYYWDERFQIAWASLDTSTERGFNGIMHPDPV